MEKFKVSEADKLEPELELINLLPLNGEIRFLGSKMILTDNAFSILKRALSNYPVGKIVIDDETFVTVDFEGYSLGLTTTRLGYIGNKLKIFRVVGKAHELVKVK